MYEIAIIDNDNCPFQSIIKYTSNKAQQPTIKKKEVII